MQLLATDGSGVPPYLRSPPFLLFSVQCLIVGVVLTPFGKRLWRVTTGLGLGLLLEWTAWIITINHTEGDGIQNHRLGRATVDIIVWAISFGLFLVGAALGAFFWRVGVLALSACAGLALAVSILMMADNTMPAGARYSVLTIVIVAVLAICVLMRHSHGMIFASAITGSFLFFLSIDLFVNKLDGMSLGLRFIFDNNEYSLPALTEYRPPVSTRVLLAVSWLVMIAASALQYALFRKMPFGPGQARNWTLHRNKHWRSPDSAEGLDTGDDKRKADIP